MRTNIYTALNSRTQDLLKNAFFTFSPPSRKEILRVAVTTPKWGKKKNKEKQKD